LTDLKLRFRYLYGCAVKDADKTKESLNDELQAMRERVLELEGRLYERARAEKGLSDSEERFRLLADNTVYSIFQTDIDFNLLYVNESSFDIIGYLPEEIVGSNVRSLFSPGESDRIETILAEELLKGPPHKGVIFEAAFLHKDGREIPTEITARINYDRAGKPTGVQGSVCDVTERKRSQKERIVLEEQLYQSQKMEAVGRLAGGVAHDMNNILTAIMGSVEALGMEMEKAGTAAQDIQNILNACRKGSNLTRNLLGFARKGKYQKEYVSLNDAARRVHELLKHTISKKVVIETSLDTELDLVEGDSSQLESALMNICINASDAMDGEGRLSISTENVVLDGITEGTASGLKPGNYVKLKVSDTGAGMDRETQARAFEPFFTTKPKGEGTGLGLSMVYGVVTNHGGTVTIGSEPGIGTEVMILLPKLERRSRPSQQERVRKTPSSIPGRGCVLLVDDEKVALNSTYRLLEKMGYKVFLAGNGVEALKIFKDNKKHIDVVLLDLIMPQMDGPETFEELKKVDSNVRVLLVSGYSMDDKVEELLKKGAAGFLKKPFDGMELSTALKRALG
jgi:two-component system cell cycle sensor histidine kinase/response regulator CckA